VTRRCHRITALCSVYDDVRLRCVYHEVDSQSRTSLLRKTTSKFLGRHWLCHQQLAAAAGDDGLQLQAVVARFSRRTTLELASSQHRHVDPSRGRHDYAFALRLCLLCAIIHVDSKNACV